MISYNNCSLQNFYVTQYSSPVFSKDQVVSVPYYYVKDDITYLEIDNPVSTITIRITL